MNPLFELRQSTNDTARAARNNYFLLLVVALFIAILVANTSDTSLLTRERLDLPLMQIGIFIDHFYGAAPIVFVLLHLNLLLRLDRLAHVAGLLKLQVDRLKTPLDKTHELALLLPFDFLQLLLYKANRPFLGEPPRLWPLRHYQKYDRDKHGNFFVLLLIVSLPTFVLPPVIIIWMQLRFLPYQSEQITLVQQSCLLVDLAAQTFLFIRLGVFKNLLSTAKTSPAPLERPLAVMHLILLTFFPTLLLAFSRMIAIVPDSWTEKKPCVPEASRMDYGSNF